MPPKSHSSHAKLLRRLAILAVCAITCCANAADPDVTFARANTLLEAGKYTEAIPLLKDVLIAFPKSEGALWNLGVAAGEVGDYPLALETWTRYRAAAPKDAKATAKLIQTYQSLGRFADRDRERESLLAFRRTFPAEDIEKFAFYCRDQFRIAGTKVMAFEYFEPQGPRRVFYRFAVLDDTGRERLSYSLGSYDATTQMARELGEIPADARAYHLDKYEGTYHATYVHFKSMPGYDTIRAMVAEAMTGKARPLSETRVTESK